MVLEAGDGTSHATRCHLLHRRFPRHKSWSKILPIKFFKSELSFAQFRTPELKSICAFADINKLIGTFSFSKLGFMVHKKIRFKLINPSEIKFV